ncbi:MAG: molybdenum cofactor guanylyltransferase [Fuerstiella sp.]
MTLQPSLAAIVLCGGRSRRMGQDKASLQIGEKTFLEHTCETAAQLATPIIVVAAARQLVPEFNNNVMVVRDNVAYPGPLPALLQGFETLLNQTPLAESPLAETPLGESPTTFAAPTSVWVTGCDTPFVTPQIIASLWKQQQRQTANVATLTQSGRDNPLLAVYEIDALRKLKPFLQTGQVRATDFLTSLNVFRQPVEAIPRDQNAPAATTNLNTQDDFKQAFGSNQDC